MIAPRVETRTANLVIKQHDKDRPAAGVAYDEWVSKTAKQYNLTEKQVRTVVAREAEAYSLMMRQSYATHAQKLSHLMGLTMITTIETVAKGLTAVKEDILKGEGGASLMGADGKARVHRQPDWRARADFAKIAVNIHGMNAPELVQMEVTGKVELTSLPEEELKKRLADAHQRIAGLLASTDARSSGGNGTGANGAAGGTGPAVLDAEVYQDGR